MARIVRIRALLEKAVDVPLGPDVSRGHNIIDVDVDSDDDADVADDDEVFVRAEGSAEVDMPRKDKTEKEKEKKKTKRLAGTAEANGIDRVAVVTDDDVDDDDVNALLRGQDDSAVDVDIDSRKRSKLNQLVGAMEGERKNQENRRMLSADVDHQPEKAGMRS